MIRNKCNGLPTKYIMNDIKEDNNEQYYKYISILKNVSTKVNNSNYDTELGIIIDLYDAISDRTFYEDSFNEIETDDYNYASDYDNFITDMSDARVIYKANVFDVAAREESLQPILYNIIQDAICLYLELEEDGSIDMIEGITLDATKIVYISENGERIK